MLRTVDVEADEQKEGGADAPSVTARLSAVSLREVPPVPHLHDDLELEHGEGAFNSSSMEVSNLGTSPAMVQSPSFSASEACTPSISQVGVSHCQQEAFLQEEKQEVDAPCWAEMLPDVLAKIFSRLSLREILCTIPCVCRYWQCVSQNPACWQNIDLSEWSSDKQPKIVDKMLLLLVSRSQGGLRMLSVLNLKNDSMLQLIANSGSQLQVLRIPDSFVSEGCLCEMASKLSFLTYLDISGRFPSWDLIKIFGKHCKFITRLNLNMRLHVRESKSCDIAALALAQHMPQLQHLEMAYGLLSDTGLKALLEACRDLVHLDLRGCWHLDMEESLMLEARKRIKVFYPPLLDDDIYDMSEFGDDYDDDDGVDSIDYMFDDPEYYDELMYDDLGDDFEGMHARGYEVDDWEIDEEMESFDEEEILL